MGAKLRLLCLPGWRTSATIMRKQLEIADAKSLEDIAEFVVINPTHVATAKPPRSVLKLDSEGPYYSWTSEEMTTAGVLHRGLEDSLEDVHKVLISQGPFDGVLGFSLGANMSNTLCCLQNQGDKRFVSQFWFVIAIAANWPGDCEMLAILKDARRLTTPSLHIYGLKDPFSDNAMEVALQLYENPRILSHPRGHIIPKFEGKLGSDVREFLLDMLQSRSRI